MKYDRCPCGTKSLYPNGWCGHCGSGGDGGRFKIKKTETSWRCRSCGQSLKDDVVPLLIGVIVVGLPASFVFGILFTIWQLKAQP